MRLTNKQRCMVLMPIMIVLMIVLMIMSMNIGLIDISGDRIIETLFGGGTEDENLVLWVLRFPKTAVAIAVGLCLAVSGAVMQGVTRNPLATPSMLGVNSGANLGVLIAILISDMGMGMVMTEPVAAVLGGLLAFTLVYTLSTRYNLSPTKLILNGIAINSCLGAVTLALSMKLSDDAYTMRSLFMAGNLGYATWPMVTLGYIIAIPLLGYVIYKAFHLNILNLNEELGIGLGLDLRKERKKLLYVTVILTSVSAYLAGGISFIGMIAPHIAKRIVGSNYKLFLPLAVVIGINIVMLSDVLTRFLSVMGTDIPIGTIISIVGAPYLLYLLFAEDR